MQLPHVASRPAFQQEGLLGRLGEQGRSAPARPASSPPQPQLSDAAGAPALQGCAGNEVSGGVCLAAGVG